jgi:hypothetical protein
MPAKSEKQRRMMGADLQRAREGKRTRTGMSEEKLEHFASKRKHYSPGDGTGMDAEGIPICQPGDVFDY